MSRSSVVDDDSDEDKVVFLDYDSVSVGNPIVNEKEARTLKRGNPTKFKSLFQQRRYNGDVG